MNCLNIIKLFDRKNNNILSHNFSEIKDEIGRNGLFYLVTNEYIDLLKDYLNNDKSLLNTEDIYADTILFAATCRDNYLLIQTILVYDININHVNKSNHTCLWNAIHCKDTSILRLLIDNGLNVEHKDNEGLTIRGICKRFGYKNMLEI